MPDKDDDELIARLRQAAGPSTPRHDPFFDLPIAKEKHISSADVEKPEGSQCMAQGRRVLEASGLTSYPTTVQISCERAAGHAGPHRAHFTQTHLSHRWRALEWDSVDASQ